MERVKQNALPLRSFLAVTCEGWQRRTHAEVAGGGRGEGEKVPSLYHWPLERRRRLYHRLLGVQTCPQISGFGELPAVPQLASVPAAPAAGPAPSAARPAATLLLLRCAAAAAARPLIT